MAAQSKLLLMHNAAPHASSTTHRELLTYLDEIIDLPHTLDPIATTLCTEPRCNKCHVFGFVSPTESRWLYHDTTRSFWSSYSVFMAKSSTTRLELRQLAEAVLEMMLSEYEEKAELDEEEEMILVKDLRKMLERLRR